MKIKKDDQVLVISGDEKGKKGTVSKSLPSKNKVVIEGVNLAKKHIRPKQRDQKGQVVKVAMPMDVSKVKLICPKCGQASRINYDASGETKVRVCKKCNAKL
jgi:large subunit ribosomal protein L24